MHLLGEKNHMEQAGSFSSRERSQEAENCCLSWRPVSFKDSKEFSSSDLGFIGLKTDRMVDWSPLE